MQVLNKVQEAADKVDAKLDALVSKVPFVGKKVAALTTGTVLIVAVVAIAVYIIVK